MCVCLCVCVCIGSDGSGTRGSGYVVTAILMMMTPYSPPTNAWEHYSRNTSNGTYIYPSLHCHFSLHQSYFVLILCVLADSAAARPGDQR